MKAVFNAARHAMFDEDHSPGQQVAPARRGGTVVAQRVPPGGPAGILPAVGPSRGLQPVRTAAIRAAEPPPSPASLVMSGCAHTTFPLSRQDARLRHRKDVRTT